MVHQEKRAAVDAERAAMRARLVGLALASTLLVLTTDLDRALAGGALLVYALAVGTLRALAGRVGGALLAWVGAAIDLAFASALALLIPLANPSWPFYAVAIATTAMRFGPTGAAIATAASIVSYDGALALRAGEARALDLVPVQALLALGVLVAELAWVIARDARERRMLRAYAAAQLDLAAAPTADELVRRLTSHRVTLAVEGDLGADAGRDLDAYAAPLLETFRLRDALGARNRELEALAVALRDELRGRDEAVASAVHELRTPLTSVQGYGQLMSRNLEAVQRQVAQLDRLIGDLLRLEGGPIALDATAPVDLLREARDAANRLRMVSESEVKVISNGSDFVVRGDRGRLAQVFDNLLRNAAKFSPPHAPILVTVRREGEYIAVSLADRGAGIPPDELTRIFERYYRGVGHRTVPGEGIGLAVAREIVTAHGGRIWATSAGPGQGSTFTMTFPAAVADATGAAVMDPTAVERRAG